MLKEIIRKNLISFLEKYFPDKKFRRPRIWSNEELKKIAHILEGDIVNVSGWKDKDKRGRKYQDYFVNRRTYSITNYTSNHAGFQNQPGEVILDLRKELPSEFTGRWDVVFNHTTLEHIYDIKQAFKNLCSMSRDLVVVVVPWMQELHYGDGYEDYWRVSPFALRKMFSENDMELVHLVANNGKKESVYILAIGSKQPEKWKDKLKIDMNAFKNLGGNIIRH